jgi:hypothetical protein
MLARMRTFAAGRATLAVVSLALLSCGGGESKVEDPKAATPVDSAGQPASPVAEPGPSAAEPSPAVDPLAGITIDPAREGLAKTAGSVVARIGELEQHKDVTCWTSFRQLDNFIAEKTYSDAATLTKIVASKALVEAMWVAATEKAAGAPVDAAHLQAVVGDWAVELPEERKAELQKYADDQNLQIFRDYRTTSEHWRVVLSIATDQLARRAPDVAPLTPEGEDALALLATRVALALLTESGEIATAARSPFIEPDHVQAAYVNLEKKLGLPAAAPRVAPAPAEDDPVALAVRKSITRKMIDAKIEALRAYNHTSGDLHAELDRISKSFPLTDAGADKLFAELQAFAAFFAAGKEPMRADNYLADGNFAAADTPGRSYVDAAYVENAIMQRFPHVMMPNGDLKLRFEPRPGHISARDLEPQDVTLLDHHMNAVRDTAVHWEVLRRVYDEQPFAMDAFAGEYLSEIVSVVATFHLRRAQTMARQQGKTELGPELFEDVEDVGYAMVMPEVADAPQWGPREEAKAAKVRSKLPAPIFTDVSATSGLPTTLAAATAVDPADLAFDIQEVMGSGVAVGDVDGDGWSDLFFTGPGLHKLYLGVGESAPGTFRDATKEKGIEGGADDGRGPLFVDFDGDGDLDLFVARSRHPSQLWENRGATFVDVAASRGLVTGHGAHVGTWLDYDRDGDLDLYLGYYGSAACNRGECEGRNLPSLDGRNGTKNQLFRNDGERFTEVGAAAKVDDEGWTLAASAFDYDRDGDLDLYLANDFGANPLFRNEGDGTFVDVATELGAADRGSGMNVSFTDLDGDGAFDVFVSNIDMFSKTIKVVFPEDASVVNLDDRVLQAFQYLSGNKLYRNVERDGARRFVAVEGEWFPPGDRGWGWAAPFFDVDNDGDEDVYLANGWIPGSPAADQKNQLFLRDGDAFWLADPASPEAFAGNSRAVVAFDADRDGDLDLAVSGYAEPPRLLRNDQATGNGWVEVRLKGTGVNTRGVGAVLVASAGGRTMRRQVTCGVGYLGQDDDVLHLGLGRAKCATVEVTWPSGTTQRFGKLAAGQIHELVEAAP